MSTACGYLLSGVFLVEIERPSWSAILNGSQFIIGILLFGGCKANAEIYYALVSIRLQIGMRDNDNNSKYPRNVKHKRKE